MPETGHSINARLEVLRRKLGYETLAEWRRALGEEEGEVPGSYAAMRTWHRDREPPASYLAQVVRRFGVSAQWLLTGEGEPFDEEWLTIPGDDLERALTVYSMAHAQFAQRLPLALAAKYVDAVATYLHEETGAEEVEAWLVDYLAEPLRRLGAENVLRYGQLSEATRRYLDAALLALSLAEDAAGT